MIEDTIGNSGRILWRASGRTEFAEETPLLGLRVSPVRESEFPIGILKSLHIEYIAVNIPLTL